MSNEVREHMLLVFSKGVLPVLNVLFVSCVYCCFLCVGLFKQLLQKIPDLRTLNTLHSEKLLGECGVGQLQHIPKKGGVYLDR